MAEIGRTLQVPDKHFAAHLPTRTIVEVKGLNQNDDIEIKFIAARQG